MSKIEISIVVPVYQSGHTISTLFERIRSTFVSSKTIFEVIFVDDASPDNSWNQIQEVYEQHPRNVVAIQLTNNFGQHNALMAGFHHARGEIVITMDDDLQHAPEDLPKLIETINDGGFDLVYGTYESKKHTSWRNLGSRITNCFFKWVFSVNVAPTSFRAIRRQLIVSILDYNKNFTVIDGLLAWCTGRIGEARISHQEREHGSSGYTIRKLLLHALNVLTNFSLIPLQTVTAVGMLLSVSGLLLAVYYVVQYAIGEIGVPGYASLIVAILVTSGAQIMSLGVIGEYVGRILLNSNEKPQFVVRTIQSEAVENVSRKS